MLSAAGKLEMIMELIGGQPILDEYGNEIGTTPRLITKEEALILLNSLEDNKL